MTIFKKSIFYKKEHGSMTKKYFSPPYSVENTIYIHAMLSFLKLIIRTFVDEGRFVTIL